VDTLKTAQSIPALRQRLMLATERRGALSLGSSSGSNGYRLPALLLTALFLIFAFIPVSAQTHPTEFQVKAAYVYNFGKFIKWPAEATPSASPFEICVLGKDSFAAVLDTTVSGESIDRRSIAVKRISNPQEAVVCNILFIGLSEESRLKVILTATQHLSILTVSDIPHFAERGGMVGFVSQGEKIRFEVNVGTAEQSHLALSSELLKVASRVISKPTS
jgi:YfiR/HmsC-like